MESIIPIEEVEKDDILIVKAGESIPVDGILTDGTASIDESAITGESIPVDKQAGDKVIGATVNKSGYFQMQATKVGEKPPWHRLSVSSMKQLAPKHPLPSWQIR